MRGNRYAGLDIVRAIAALAVLTLHVSANPAVPHGVLQAIAAKLNGGVAIFFVLSGYLLYRPFAKATLGGVALPDRRRFWNNRARRIIPAYWAALAVYGLLGLLYNAPSAPHLAACFAFLQVWFPHHTGDGIPPAWTLCSEAAFYLMLPLLAAWLGSRGGREPRRILRDLGIAIVTLALLHVLVGDVGARMRPVVGELDQTIIGTLDMFLVGMALAVVAADDQLRVRVNWLVPRRRVAWPLALALYLAVAGFGAVYDVAQWTLVDRAWMMTISLLLIGPLVLREGDAPSGQVARVFSFLGLVSYGIYIWQYPFVRVLQDRTHLPVAARSVIDVVGVIAIGVASYYVIERPFISSRRSQQPAPLPVPVVAD